jgi:hypothetical protein
MRPSPSQPPFTSAGSSRSGTSSAAPKNSVSVLDRQLARLHGESLFGPWLDPSEFMALRGRQRRRVWWTRRIAIALLLVAAVSGGTWLTGYGLSRREAQERTRVAKDVAAFLAEGELERLAQFVAILSPPAEQLQANDPYLDLVVQAEAALYRYRDASPARLARIHPYLSADGASPRRFVARMTVASVGERSAAYERLSKLQSSLADDPEFWALMASAEEGRNVARARASWDRSFELGPLWLPHRYQQCLFEARQGKAEALARLVGHMAKVAPDSPWTHLARSLRDRPTASPPAPGTDATPVVQHHQQLALVFGGPHPGEVSANRRQALGRALDAVNSAVPFLLDAFDRLMAIHANELATEMTSYEAWPRDNPLAQARLERIPKPNPVHPAAAEPVPAKPEASSVRAPARHAGAASKPQGDRRRKAGKAKHQRGGRPR